MKVLVRKRGYSLEMRIYLKEVALNCNIQNYHCLFTRPLGESVRRKTIEMFEDYFKSGEKVILDCSEIEDMSPSFLEQFFLSEDGLIRHLIKKNVVLILDNVCEDLEHSIRTSFIGVEGKNSIIIIKDNEYHLISYKDEKQVKTFEVVKKAPITARELADLEGIEINSASNRLYRLYKNGLAFRSEKVESDGKSYLYYL